MTSTSAFRRIARSIANFRRRRAPKSFDMRFYGQFEPPQDQIIYESYFADSEPGFFLECGAFDGMTESSCFVFEESLGWVGANVEASPAIYPLLVKNRPKSKNIFAALSDKSGEGRFLHAVHPLLGNMFGNGSLNHTPEHKTDLLR